MASADPILQSALTILEAGASLSKDRVAGAPLTTKRSGPRILDPAVVDLLRAGGTLDRDMQKSLIFALDLLAAGAPDNAGSGIDKEVQRVAGKLRERYARAYKSSAYSDAG
ncbi:hypothetical protein [uncultured Roseobacter sp.]|uniref:hypothetical protein n=1 Tax=uncultured Roseobacter sp. TaxID=114847 RepID=UPI002602D36E|nr:hypothetical protein [uncultured Roseobacter sp.]